MQMYKNDIPHFQSYFWLRAPAGEIVSKTQRKTGGLAAVFDGCAKTHNDLSRLMCVVENIFPDPHLTIFEQPRSQDEAGVFRFQPIDDVETLLEMTEVIQDVASGYMPLSYAGQGLEVLVKTNKVHLALNFNSGAKGSFSEFYEDLMGELSEFRAYDLYKEDRLPRLILSKGYISDTKMNVSRVRSAVESFNVKNDSFVTKPIEFDSLILGQGLYDIHGNRLASRDVATVYFDGKLFEWHCDDPFDQDENTDLINAIRPRHAPTPAGARRRPSLVA